MSPFLEPSRSSAVHNRSRNPSTKPTPYRLIQTKATLTLPTGSTGMHMSNQSYQTGHPLPCETRLALTILSNKSAVPPGKHPNMLPVSRQDVLPCDQSSSRSTPTNQDCPGLPCNRRISQKSVHHHAAARIRGGNVIRTGIAIWHQSPE